MQQRLSCNFITAVRHNLIDIHVRRRSASGLPDDQRKIALQLSVQDLVAHLTDQLLPALIQLPESAVCDCRSFFQNRKCADDLLRHFLCADFKILIAALCLCAPVDICRHAHFSHRIMFDSVFHSLLL